MSSDDFARTLAEKMQDPKFRGGYEDGEQLDHLIDALIELRLKMGCTQSELARAMGVKQPTVSGFENQDSDPRISTVQRYARALGARLRLSVECRDDAGSWTTDSRMAKWAGATTPPNDDTDFGLNQRCGVVISASLRQRANAYRDSFATAA